MSKVAPLLGLATVSEVEYLEIELCGWHGEQCEVEDSRMDGRPWRSLLRL